jgi:trk system potassium uptake protein TrkH
VLAYLGVGSKSLFRNESSFQTGEATTARIRDTALMLWKIYLLITLVCAVGLRLMGLSWFSAVAHSFTAVSTGGFSPHNESIGFYSGWGNGWLIELWLSLVMTACSMNFLIYVVIVRRAWKRLKKEEDGSWFIGVCLFVALLIAGGIAIEGGGTFWEAPRGAWFTVVSIATTTGFGTVDYEKWPIYGQAALAALMVVGGCSGSTAGGMKISRMLVFMKTVRHEVVRAFRPNQVFRMSVNGNSFDDKARQQTLLFIALYGTILGASSVFIGLFEAGTGISLETCLGSALATLSNIGPGFGSIGPTENFAHLRAGTQVFLSLLMVLGRLELFAILVLFIPAAWRKY